MNNFEFFSINENILVLKILSIESKAFYKNINNLFRSLQCLKGYS